MRQPEELPAPLRGVAFEVSTAASLGVNRGRLRRRDLRRPFHGVRAPVAGLAPTIAAAEAADSDDERWAHLRASGRLRAHEYAARMPTDQFFSHLTAAILHGFPLPTSVLARTTIDVATNVRSQRRQGRSVRGHLASSEGVRTVRVAGLPVASALDTWAQLSTMLSLDQLVMIGDALVCRKNPVATMPELAAAVVRHTGRRGVRRLREAFSLVRTRTDSARETELRLLIVRERLPEPEVNPAILNRFGEFLAFGDLTYPHFKVLVEYDGKQHGEDEKQYLRDVDRLESLMAEGWRIIRVNKKHLWDERPQTLDRIRMALLERGWRPGA